MVLHPIVDVKKIAAKILITSTPSPRQVKPETKETCVVTYIIGEVTCVYHQYFLWLEF